MAEPTRPPTAAPSTGAVRPEPTRTDAQGRHVRPQGPATAEREHAAVDPTIDISDRDHGSERHTEPPGERREEPDRSID